MGSDCDYCHCMIGDGERVFYSMDVATGEPDGRLWAHRLCYLKHKEEENTAKRRGRKKGEGDGEKPHSHGVGGGASNAGGKDTSRANKGIVVIAGPSGVGKSTIIRFLLRQHPERFGYSTSHTTRPPRDGEVDGVHYHFVSCARFEELVRDGSFVEHTVYSGNRYGTSRDSVMSVVDSGRKCLLDLDMEGVRSMRATTMPCDYVFVVPPSLGELRRRMTERGDGEGAIEQRMGLALGEVEQGTKPGAFHHVLVNDSLDRVVSRLEDLLLA